MQEPTHKTKYSAGADLSASEDVIFLPGDVELVPTGFSLSDLPPSCNYNGLTFILAIRSSLTLKQGLMLANGIGVIDSDYLDEVKVMLFNPTDEIVTIEKGQRIAQLIPMQYVTGVFPVEENNRNGGFGSTGRSS